jgi:eukaryotic-like serine/threonine-protein kinase
VTLVAGGRLGPFEIVAPIGAGGMGEVYQARDTRLGRTVAIKILPERLGNDPDRMARFEREARAVSQLAHPHVCTLHDVGEQDGVHFIVMEHCEGETLAERLRRGAMELAEVLRLGAQIAEALHAAHRQGIVHRDLKPGNIMITSSGVKLLDFGLARMAAGDGALEEGIGSLQTLARDPEQPLTAEGTVVGTYPYMAPEQVEGAETDARSDIFSLGAVLYEMATGKRAFEGKSAASVMAAVLKEQPEAISKVQPVSPPALDHVVSRCLEKDAEERWQSARDVAVELRWISEAGSGAGVAAPVARRRRSRERLAWLTAGALGLLLLLLAAAWIWTSRPVEPPVVRVPIAIPEGANLWGSALSPDGTMVAYALWREGKGQLYLHPLSRLEPSPVLGATDARLPFFSPDGRWIGYFADGELRKIPVSGGSPITLCATDSMSGASWGEDGTIVFSKSAPSAIWKVPDSGGTPVAITSIRVGAREDRVDSHFHPQPLPGGRGIVFTAWSPGARVEDAVTVLPAGSDQPRTITPGAHPAYDPAGHLLYVDVDRRVLNAVPFDLEALEVRGTPRVIAQEVGNRVSTSRAGTLLYEVARETPRRLTRVDRDGVREVLPLPEQEYGLLLISPDGRRAAMVIQEGTAEIWVVDLERWTFTRLTNYPGYDHYPVWSPDGEWIVFSSDRDGPPNLYRVRPGGGEVERLTNAYAVQRADGFTPDGRRLVISYRDIAAEEAGAPSTYDIGILDLESGDLTPLIASAAEERGASLSPDGRWLVYASNETGRWELYLRSLTDAGRKIRVSLDGIDSRGVWAPDGKTIYYAKSEKMIAVPVSAGPDLSVGRPVEIFDVPELVWFDVGPDGRFVISERTAPREQGIVAVLNWAKELDQEDR